MSDPLVNVLSGICRLLEIEDHLMMMRHLKIWHKDDLKPDDLDAMKDVLKKLTAEKYLVISNLKAGKDYNAQPVSEKVTDSSESE